MYKLFCISGPSGVGKGTICKQLIANSKNVTLSVSATTRNKTAQEVDGKDYFFKTEDEFKALIDDGAFLEWAQYNGKYYGTLKSVVDELLEHSNVILEIDVQGALQVKDQNDDVVLIFITPPDDETLLARLRGRGRESEEQIQRRFNEAKREIGLSVEYNYIVVNDDLQTAVVEIQKIIEKEGE